MLRERPYGAYILKDGSEVLYARDYTPMVKRDVTRTQLTEVPANTWVRDVSHQIYFYNDYTSPRLNNKRGKDSIKRCNQVAFAFSAGLDITQFDIKNLLSPSARGKRCRT